MQNVDMNDGGLRLRTGGEVSDNPNYPFSQSAMRHLIFCSEDRLNSKGETIPGNGLAKAGAIIRVGRKVLIELNAFDKWLENQRSAS